MLYLKQTESIRYLIRKKENGNVLHCMAFITLASSVTVVKDTVGENLCESQFRS